MIRTNTITRIKRYSAIVVALLMIMVVFILWPQTKIDEPEVVPEPDIVEEAQGYKVKARITKYAWTGNPMANGEYPYIGAVASSDRSIPFGTRVEIDGKVYEVKDRTALWVHQKHGLTFDIYSEDSREEMLQFGDPEIIVKILTD